MSESRRSKSGTEPPRRNGARPELKKRAARRNATLVKSNKKLSREIAGRTRAEQALDIEQQRFETLAENAPYGMCLIAADGTFDYLNRAFMEMFGYDLHDIPDGKTWFQKAFPDPAYRHDVVACWREDFGEARPGKAKPRIFTVRCQDGIDKIIHFRPVMLPGGDYLMTCEDITERTHAEETLRLSEQRLELALKGADLALWDWNIPTGELFFNERWPELLGFSPTEIDPHIDSWKELIHPEDANRVFDAVEAHFSGRTRLYEAEYRLKAKTGEWRWVLDRGMVFERDPDGKPLRAAGTHLDITRNRRLEEERDRLFNLSLDLLCVSGFDGHFKQINPAWHKILGWTEEELLSRPWLDFVHRDDLAATLDAGKTLLAGTAIRYFENRFLCKDGSYKWLSWNSFPLPEEKLIFTVAHDATQRKTTEANLAAAQALLLAAVEQTPAGIIIADAPDAKIRIANSAAMALRGVTSTGVGAFTAPGTLESWKTFHPDGTPFTLEERPLALAVLHGKTSRNVEVVMRRNNGDERWLLANAAPVRNSDGQVIAGVVVLADITDLKLAEQELRKSEEKYRGIIEAITDGYHEADLKGNITFCNDYLCAIVGCTREQFLGTSYRELMDEANAQEVLSSYNRVFRTGKAEQALQFVFTRPDGAKRDVSASVSLVRSPNGKPSGFRGIMRDVTEQKRLQEKLHQASKMEAIGRLAGGIAHDFNNLLTAVLGYANVLMQQLPHESRHQEKLIQIVRAAERAAGLTKQLLAFSRKQLLDVRVLDLNEVISGLEEMLRRLIGEDIELTTVYAGDLGTVRADVGQLEQILMNLVVNSRDAMPDGGELSIETANVVLDEQYARKHTEVTAGPYVLVAVSDTGIGMDSATLARIFDPFFTTKAKGVGTGLGLSTVYGIVKQHHGHVAVYSEPGRGTTFKVYLPRASAVLEREDQTVTQEPRPVGNETILIVEDAEVVRDLVGEVLGMLGYLALKAADPHEALRISDTHIGPIHLLLTDVVLPHMDGRSLHRRIVSTRPDMKVMYMSGYTDNFIVHHGVLDRGVHFIQKPFSVDNLAKKVREALDSPGTSAS